MKKLIVALSCLVVAFALNAAQGQAQGAAGQKQQLTPEQKQAKKALIEKYDANKDGKLDRDELAKMTPEDKDQWQKLSPAKAQKQGQGKKKTQ